jgi:hypothetical protein
MPAGLTEAPKNGFWVSPATTTGAKSTVEVQLFPYPTWVEYPWQDIGEVQETADGRTVVQVGNHDPRRYSWVWANFGNEIATYERQYQHLRSFRARDRQVLGQNPYAYVYDGSVDGMQLRRAILFTNASLSGTTVAIPDLSSTVHASAITNGWLEITPATGGSSAAYERRRVVTVTNTSLTLESAFSSDVLNNSDVLLTWQQPVWFRVRVVEVTREMRSEGGSVRYNSTRFAFVVDDTVGVHTLDYTTLTGSPVSEAGAFSATAFSSVAFSPAAFDGV